MFFDSLYCFILGKVVQIGRQLDKLIWGGDNHKFCRWTDTVPADVIYIAIMHHAVKWPHTKFLLVNSQWHSFVAFKEII